MEKWMLMRKGADFQRIGEEFKISPRLASLIRNKDIIEDKDIRFYLHGNITQLWDGMLMKDMDKAIAILREKVDAHSKIRVIGDYDVDGICATYILLEGLKRLGACVDSDIPDRVEDGYGLSMGLIERAKMAGVDTIITCDNGIAASDEIAYAKNIGMTTIITDHHEVPYEVLGEDSHEATSENILESSHEVMGENAGKDSYKKDSSIENEKRVYILPQADAIVDPKQVDCSYPFKGLCGAAVAYKLVEALFETMGEDASDVDYLIEFVAMATVADVMDLQGENRVFVKEGLDMMKRTQNIGLRALIDCTQIDTQKLAAYHIGFVLGPCLNASGRLDTAKRALDLLCAQDVKQAEMLAGDLRALNESRKDMTEKAVEDAIAEVEDNHLLQEPVLVVYLPNCHESLAGIVAGRIREKYHRPTFVLTAGEDGVKGSGRSIPTYNMYEELNKCKQLFVKFGGHKLAAGFSLKGDAETFCKRMNEVSILQEEDLIKKVQIDMKLSFAEITQAFITELEQLAPFGKGNEKPVFAESGIRILGGKVLGKKRNVFKMQVEDATGNKIDAIYFGDIEGLLAFLEQKGYHVTSEGTLTPNTESEVVSFVYYPSINEYQGCKTIQIVVGGYQ